MGWTFAEFVSKNHFAGGDSFKLLLKIVWKVCVKNLLDCLLNISSHTGIWTPTQTQNIITMGTTRI